MSTIFDLPPFGFTPDELNLYYTVMSPPFSWIVRRGKGFVICQVDLMFQDGVERRLDLTVGRYPTYPGFYADLRFQSDLWLTLGFVDGKPPFLGRAETFLPPIRKVV